MAEEIITSTNAETATDHEYNASEIQVLKGLEAVRKRPGMYIGSTGERGLHHLVYEIVDNAIDEALAGYCNHIEVKILKDNIIQVTDNGRGIPVDIQADTGLPAVTVVYTILHAGGKFGGENSGYKVAGGLHGVGASVVNACSEWLTVNVRRDGKEYEQTFRRGDPDGPLKCIGTVEPGVTGTRVTFKPDPEMFRDTTVYDFDTLEKRLRARLPKTPQGELLGGAIVAFCLPVGTFLLTSLVCLGAARISPWLGLAVQMFWCGQALAAKGLAQESTNVYRELVKPDLPAARRAVSRIVGRDTQDLTLEGVTRAAVETVAENASDGVIAPLLYMLIGGAPLALTYKAINTMDSMLGYKNEKYLYFGRIPAKLDDAANYLPSRLAALLWVAAAAFTRNDAKGAWKIWRRDRRNHASPNSAQTESACAGALGVQLAGPAYYFGEYYAKPTIGDPLRPIEPEDILRANRMMYVASAFALAWGVAIRAIL